MSSENARKAQLTKNILQKKYPHVCYCVPRLNDEPELAISAISQLIQTKQNNGNSVALIGSSLGGFYAHYFAEVFNIPAVLINPAVEPYCLLINYLGEQVNPHTGNKITLTKRHISELKKLEKPVKNSNLIQVWLEEADEVLDYQKALKYFAKCNCNVRSGGDHSYQNFVSDCPAMLEFLLAKPQNQ